MGISYLQLSELTGKTRQQITNAVFLLQLPTFLFRGEKRVTKKTKEVLIDYFNKPTVPLKKNPPKKISIIEQYIERQSIKAVSRTLKLNRQFVTETVKEWQKNDEYIIVDSSMNIKNNEHYTGVFQRGKKWCFELRIKGERFRKSGFNTEEEALEARIECKKINS